MTNREETAAGDRNEPGSCPADEAELPPEPDESPNAPDASSTGCGTDVSVSVLPGAPQIPNIDWLQQHLRTAVAAIDHPVSRVSVLIVNDDRMIELHRRHLAINETTDVLTFPVPHAGEAIDVDIAICLDEATRQAQQHDHRIEHELLLYALHGVLHCAGFDDHGEDDYRAMHEEEDRILRAIGVGATFKRSRTGHDDDRANVDRDSGARS